MLKDGDILTYDNIEERLVGKASLTGLVQSRSSFERFERFKAGGFYSSKQLRVEDSRELGSTERERQHEAKHQGRWKVAPAARGLDRQNSDKDDDIHSSQDFWEEIGPKMNMNAALLDLSAAAALKTQFLNKDSDSDDGDGRSKMPSEFPGGAATSKLSKGL